MHPARPRVLLTDPIAPDGHRVLEREADIVQAPDGEPDTVRRLAREADGAIIRSKLPDDIFEAAPRLRAVVIHGTGTDLVPLEVASRRGIPVANLPGANARSVAEYCAMAMLTLARNTLAITNAMRTQPWDAARGLGAGAHEIGAMTLGLVGVGAIGQHLAKIARRGLGMRVIGNQRRLDRMGPDAEPATLEALLHGSDFVVLTCPLTPLTRHLMNPRTFSLMKRSAWLVNVGRGAVVQETALVDALRTRRIAGAMLDVYEHYRIAPGHPLFGLDNVVLTPHLAGMTVESRARMASAAAEEVLRMLRGEPPLNPVNAEALHARPAHH